MAQFGGTQLANEKIWFGWTIEVYYTGACGTHDIKYIRKIFKTKEEAAVHWGSVMHTYPDGDSSCDRGAVFPFVVMKEINADGDARQIARFKEKPTKDEFFSKISQHVSNAYTLVKQEVDKPTFV